ncbi:hypothetical protein B0H14DRAFT_2601381 [Mycena olivaceomarginata]|nr:hypothetical protein B0H14DRAFT_2601381 [Mycena olivaceomarginata]
MFCLSEFGQIGPGRGGGMEGTGTGPGGGTAIRGRGRAGPPDSERHRNPIGPRSQMAEFRTPSLTWGAAGDGMEMACYTGATTCCTPIVNSGRRGRTSGLRSATSDMAFALNLQLPHININAVPTVNLAQDPRQRVARHLYPLARDTYVEKEEPIEPKWHRAQQQRARTNLSDSSMFVAPAEIQVVRSSRANDFTGCGEVGGRELEEPVD